MHTDALVALGLQFGRFALVGLGATLVHVLAYGGGVELCGLRPLAANALGFALGVNVSFAGHRSWTFRDTTGPPVVQSLARFWAVALLGFALNSLFVYVVTGVSGLGYAWAIPCIILLTPVIVFTLSKYWAFHENTTR